MNKYNYTNPSLSFLVFRSRSGSTFFGDRLSRHPEVLVTPESKAAPRLIAYFQKKYIMKQGADYKELTDYLLAEQKLKDWGLPRENLLEGLKEHKVCDWATAFHLLCRLYRDWKKPEANVVVFKKSGWYYQNIDRLLLTYPGSMAIWMIRDPRAMYNSARKAIHSETKKPLSGNILKNSLGWKDYINRLYSAEQKQPDRIIRVYYECFLHDFAGTLTRTWQELGVKGLSKPHLARIMERRDQSHLVTQATRHLHDNVDQKPIVERAEKWEEELSSPQKVLIRIICRKEMKRHNYY